MLPAMILPMPTCAATLERQVMTTTGIPFFSISLAIVAPLRVPVPQVAVRMTAPMPEPTSSSAIPAPISAILLGIAPVPVVTK